MTIPLAQILATLPSGKLGSPLDLAQLGSYLGKFYDTSNERDRNRRHAWRDELYRDGGVPYMKDFIHTLHKDPDVRDRRKALVDITRFNNPTRRIINELSTVYVEPAKRSVDDLDEDETDPNNDRYQAVLTAVRMDEVMLQVNRLANLHRAVLVRFRVRQKADGTREPTTDIATPASVRAILHPNDSTEVIGWIIKTDFRTAVVDPDMPMSFTVPAWEVWTDHETFMLREDFTIIGSSYREHGLGVNPWVPISLSPPCPGYWPGEEGEDLRSAHTSIWYLNILMIKETKSATKQPVLTGDVTTMARDQASDSDSPIEVPDGVGVSTIDNTIDLSIYRDGSDHVLTSTGNNYGMPGAVLTHQGVQSADARELMRIPIKELRKLQHITFRQFEKRLCEVMAMVLESDLPAMAFKATGFRIDFGEGETPLGALDALRVFEAERAAGVDNTIAYIMRKNPDLDEAGAIEELDENIAVETMRVAKMQKLMSMNGGMGQALQPPAFMSKEEAQLVDASAPDGGLSPQIGAPQTDPTAPAAPKANGMIGGRTAAMNAAAKSPSGRPG